VILIKNIHTLWGRTRFLLPVTYFPTNLVYPFTLRVTGIKIQFTKAENVNFIKIDDEDVPPAIKITFDKMIVKNHKAFADPDEALPFTINTLATIKTDGEPVYSRSYPHPMGATEFVNAEVKQLLADGLIRPSKSPYNNPTWVVDKKGTDQNGVKKKRLVIDFRKLNIR